MANTFLYLSQNTMSLGLNKKTGNKIVHKDESRLEKFWRLRLWRAPVSWFGCGEAHPNLWVKSKITITRSYTEAMLSQNILLYGTFKGLSYIWKFMFRGT
jgi:hypothetical protein